MADLEKIAEDLSGLTVIEAADLVKLLEEKFHILKLGKMVFYRIKKFLQSLVLVNFLMG